MRSTLAKAVGIAAAAALALTACSSGDGSPSGDGDTGSDGPIELTYWAWAPHQIPLVEAWNAANPDVQVTHTEVGGPSDTAARLLTATRAGNAPDVAMVEFPTLPSMIVGGVAADITDLTGDLETQFGEGTWGLGSFDGATYGLPFDVGPQSLTYNEARLNELGIEVPTTWAEFAEAARAVRAAAPDTYLATFQPAEFNFFAGMVQQAGGEWWSIEDGVWTVDIDSEVSKEVADFWQELIDEDAIKVEPLLTPQWNTELNAGQILSWPAGMWAPSVIHGVAPDMAGDWAMAPLPQWTPGDSAVAYQGGSAIVVTTSSKHREAAAKFAAFVTSSQEAADILLDSGTLPGSKIGQESAAEGAETPLLMPQQTDFWALAADIAGNTVPSITWGPNVNVAQSAFEEEISRALENGTPMRDALAEVQRIVVEDMKTTGFEVAE